ncbi:hypothetical protein CK203_108155 [Vitis vinifera]|uniref:Uncharacterized protein n=1 Tax=Vitis vinifera TaxID=29760 RepID=A0A438DJN2_VITVI|nr:hypothetical protein CK203_108155 [Vitis vinifera]
MARPRRAKSFSPSSHKRVTRGVPVQGPTFEPPRSKAVSPRRSPHLKILRRGVISLALSTVISGANSGSASKASRAPAPLSEPQIPSGVAPEVLIRRPMLTQSPIEGNLDCRSHPFHSELCFDTATFQLRPELADSFHLLRRYHMEHLLAPRDFFYPGASTNPHLLRGELPPSMFLIDALLRHNIYPLQHWTQRRGVLLEALFKISEGYFFGPHHLIMAALFYFEEKVHKKKLQRADAIPLLFHGCCARFWSIWGIHQILNWSANVFREVFTLEKWNNMTAYRVEQPGRPQPAEIPAARRASPRHIPEGIPIASPTISRAPPVTPVSSEPSTFAEPRMVIPISEYRELCRSLQTLTASQSSLTQEMAAIRACQEQMLTTQAQHTTILR